MATCIVANRSAATGNRARCKCSECRAYGAEQSRIWRRRYPELSRKRAKEYQLKNPDRVFETDLKTRYGITSLDYFKMLSDCGGKCQICGSVPSGNGSYAKLHIDHDHETKRVRGLLCGACNIGIGHLKHDIKILQSAEKYLHNPA